LEASAHGHFCSSFFPFSHKQINGLSDFLISVVSAANPSTTAGSSGDEIGKALASVSYFVFICFFKLVLGNETITVI